jgi:hypothetical protein
LLVLTGLLKNENFHLPCVWMHRIENIIELDQKFQIQDGNRFAFNSTYVVWMCA